MSQKGILTILSGFSGAGKGTVVKELLTRYPGKYSLSVSATTRSPRPGETDGKDYFFVSEEEFERRIREEELIEYARYVDHYYGTPSDYVQTQLEEGRDVILEIEIQGALKVKGKFPEALLIFVTPSSAPELERRLKKRGTETGEEIQNRLRRAYEEADFMELYDYILINDDLESCVETLNSIISSCHYKAVNQLPFAARIKEELSQFQ